MYEYQTESGLATKLRSSDTATRRTSPIEEALNQQGKLVRDLHFALASIETRLRPVLAPTEGGVGDAKRTEEESESLVGRINAINQHIADATMDVTALAERLQL